MASPSFRHSTINHDFFQLFFHFRLLTKSWRLRPATRRQVPLRRPALPSCPASTSVCQRCPETWKWRSTTPSPPTRPLQDLSSPNRTPTRFPTFRFPSTVPASFPNSSRNPPKRGLQVRPVLSGPIRPASAMTDPMSVAAAAWVPNGGESKAPSLRETEVLVLALTRLLVDNFDRETRITISRSDFVGFLN